MSTFTVYVAEEALMPAAVPRAATVATPLFSATTTVVSATAFALSVTVPLTSFATATAGREIEARAGALEVSVAVLSAPRKLAVTTPATDTEELCVPRRTVADFWPAGIENAAMEHTG